MNIFHSYCIIVYSTMLQWGFIGYIHFCLQLLSPEYCLCCLHMLPFTMWYFFTITAHLTLQQCLQHIRNIYIQYSLQLLSPVYLLWCSHVLSFSQCEYFSTHYCTIVYIKCLHWIFTVTYGTVYNYSAQYSVCAVYICFPFLNVNIFQHITVQLYI